MLGTVHLLPKVDEGELERGEILFADEEARTVELVRWSLEARGYRVRTAGTLADARLQLARRRPDLFVCGARLAGPTTRDQLASLSGEGLLPPTLVIAGDTDEELRRSLGALRPVLGVLRRPVEPNELARAVSQAFSSGFDTPRERAPRP
jgi:DNA-binding NtrC family response regulator